MRIAAVQHDIVWNDRSANFARLAPKIGAAAAGGARLVMLTETFSTGFGVDDPDLGEPEGGPSSQFLLDQAARHGVWVCGSCPEIPADSDPDDRRPANSFVFAGPDGTTHRYRKIHPFTYGGEDKWFRAGSDLVQFVIDGVRIAPFVCYDLRFADEFWQLAPTTDLYLVPANWPEPRRQHWMALLQARAIENQAYVVGCNRVGEGGGLRYVGDSRIVDPLGELLATGSQGETILFADVEPATVTAVRDRFRFLPDRR
ncbi:MAG TPA: nitrilase-related carbon-nitrogen hydrolase [Ilumatobacteraceae bacterium]|nr:nitrilase-related carbon-nitrogen hydrolase [Ilumatobacteraceae bacterium]HUC33637.1 nitrilase-related carbon-nitrogen hydrolase [Ilumatobacteraceae bacterium]